MTNDSNDPADLPASSRLGRLLNDEVPEATSEYFSQIDATLGRIERERTGVLPLIDRGAPQAPTAVQDTRNWPSNAGAPTGDATPKRRRWPALVAAAAAAIVGIVVVSLSAVGPSAVDSVVEVAEEVVADRERTPAATAEFGASEPPDGSANAGPAGPADEFRDVCNVDVAADYLTISPSSPVPQAGSDDFWWVLPGTNSIGRTLGVVIVEDGGAHLDDAGVVFAKSGATVSTIGKNGNAGRALFYEPGAILSRQNSLRGPLIECGEIITSIPAPEIVAALPRPIDLAFAPSSDLWPTIELANEAALTSFVFTAESSICLDRYRMLFEGLHDSSPVEASITFAAAADGTAIESLAVWVNDVHSDSTRTHSISYSSAGRQDGYGSVTDVVRNACALVAEPGEYSITIELDPENLIDETDETNNTYTRSFEVRGF